MNTPADVLVNSENDRGWGPPDRESGFTLIELMIVLVIVAIGVAIAVPTYRDIIEKREVVAAAEDVVSFINLAQSEAIKRNEQVTFSWYTSGGHSSNWCMGASLPPKDAPCDCTETVETETDFCSIDSTPYRLVQSDFVDMNNEFIHMRPNESYFSFDPVRGIVVNIEDAESVDDDYLFYVHSDRKNTEGKRLYELQIKVNITGRVTICADTDRASIIAGYPEC